MIKWEELGFSANDRFMKHFRAAEQANDSGNDAEFYIQQSKMERCHKITGYCLNRYRLQTLKMMIHEKISRNN